MNKKQTGIKRIFSAYKNSSRAFVWLLKNEAAFQQEALLACLLLPVIAFVDVGILHKLLLLFSLVFVLLVEVVNTAIEAVVDRVGKEFNQLSGLAKDLGSLAVLLSFIFAAVVWLSLLYV
ncbi:MAG: diacylglycerol kinase [Candidatus Thioglobus sp.]|nr:MAG: diacylglycerol kinase [Candidatus Thioglobus sp.]